MSGLAVFGLKCPSLLDFDEKCREKRVRHNLQSLYGVAGAPGDSQLRNVLDRVNPETVRPTTVKILQAVQKQGVLEGYRYLGGYLVSIDGTGQFSSNRVACPDCCEKHHGDGTVEYYHQLLASVIVHPDHSTVLSLFSEPIKKR